MLDAASKIPSVSLCKRLESGVQYAWSGKKRNIYRWQVPQDVLVPIYIPLPLTWALPSMGTNIVRWLCQHEHEESSTRCAVS